MLGHLLNVENGSIMMLRKSGTLVLFFMLIVCSSDLWGSKAAQLQESPVLIRADRLYDGYTFKGRSSVLIADGKVNRVDTPPLDKKNHTGGTIDLGDATLFPGFIELHAHSSLKKIPHETLLRHGITTIRDLNGVVHQPYGGRGNLRVLTSGPSITVREGGRSCRNCIGKARSARTSPYHT